MGKSFESKVPFHPTVYTTSPQKADFLPSPPPYSSTPQRMGITTNTPTPPSYSSATHPRAHTTILGRLQPHALRILTIILSFIGSILFTAAATQQRYLYSDGDGAPLDLPALGPLAYSLLECLAILITDLLLAFKFKSKYPDGMHPAIPLTFDLIAWSGTMAIAGLMSGLPEWMEYSPTNCIDRISDSKCQAVVSFLPVAEKAGVVFMFLVV
jgi:hypothetical protein